MTDKPNSVRDELSKEIERGKKFALAGCYSLRSSSLTLDFALVVAARDKIVELERRVTHFEKCMEIAGLQCFMRGQAPMEIARHMNQVAQSHTAEAEAEKGSDA